MENKFNIETLVPFQCKSSKSSEIIFTPFIFVNGIILLCVSHVIVVVEAHAAVVVGLEPLVDDGKEVDDGEPPWEKDKGHCGRNTDA